MTASPATARSRSAWSRRSGKTISIPVWFVAEGGELYLLPVQGSDTQWYRNVLKNPSIRVDARGVGAEFRATPVTAAKAVKSVIERFRVVGYFEFSNDWWKGAENGSCGSVCCCGETAICGFNSIIPTAPAIDSIRPRTVRSVQFRVFFRRTFRFPCCILLLPLGSRVRHLCAGVNVLVMSVSNHLGSLLLFVGFPQRNQIVDTPEPICKPCGHRWRHSQGLMNLDENCTRSN
jgi:hypothetical protein